MSFMMAFGLASVMLCLGMLLRAKVSFFRKMLIPSSVLGGIAGILFMNVAVSYTHLTLPTTSRV